MILYVNSRQAGAEGCFSTIQEAVDAATAAEGEACEILIAPGIYRERLSITHPHLLIRGAGPENTRIVSDLGAYEILEDGIKRGTFRTQTVFIHAHDVTLADLTIENAAGPGRTAGQAIALYADGDRLLFDNVHLLGHQDTLFCGPLPAKEIEPGGFRGPLENAPRINGRQYYRGCLISGNIDFIFGSGTAFFEACEISCRDPRDLSCQQKKDPVLLSGTASSTNDQSSAGEAPQAETLGYITAPSTPEGQAYGFVFSDCRITSACPPGTFYLGRPWREYGRSVFIRCRMDAHIKPEGWDDWGKKAAHETAFFAEYGSAGDGADISSRAAFARQLTASEAEVYDRDHVLGGKDGWLLSQR